MQPESKIELVDLKRLIEYEDSVEQHNKLKPTKSLDSSSKILIKKTKKKIDNCKNRKDFNIPVKIDSLIKIIYPEYRIVQNSDYHERYWCQFYAESESPYYTTGDFDGDGENEIVLIITKENRRFTSIVLIDIEKNKPETFLIENYEINRDIQTQDYLYAYGLKTKAPFKFKTITSDTTYDIRTDIIVINGFEEKADYFFYYQDGKYKSLMIGC